MGTLKSISKNDSKFSLSTIKMINSNEDFLSKYDNNEDVYLFI